MVARPCREWSSGELRVLVAGLVFFFLFSSSFSLLFLPFLFFFSFLFFLFFSSFFFFSFFLFFLFFLSLFFLKKKSEYILLMRELQTALYTVGQSLSTAFFTN